jgi:predicted transcriptional regulator
MLEYVGELMSKDMVGEEEEKGKKMYTLTDKGANYIQEFKKIKEFSDSFGL